MKLIIKNDTAFSWIKTDIFEVISTEQVSDRRSAASKLKKLDHCPTFIYSHVTAANIWDVVVNAKKQTIYFYSIIISWGNSNKEKKATKIQNLSAEAALCCQLKEFATAKTIKEEDLIEGKFNSTQLKLSYYVAISFHVRNSSDVSEIRRAYLLHHDSFTVKFFYFFLHIFLLWTSSQTIYMANFLVKIKLNYKSVKAPAL